MDTNEYKLSTHYSSVNKNIHIIALLAGLTHYTSYAMELTTEVKQKPTEYKKRPEEYELFRLERPYGTITRSAFDILPTDLFNAHIRGPLADVIATKFKHALLHHKHQATFYRSNPLLKTIPIENSNHKLFPYHNGKYTIAPEQYAHCMCRESSRIKRIAALDDSDNVSYVKIFQSSPKDGPNFQIWCPSKTNGSAINKSEIVVELSEHITMQWAKSTMKCNT